MTGDNVTLLATGLPGNAFGFMIGSQTQGFTAGPGGSQGNLCLGGSIGRYVAPDQIRRTTASGTPSLQLELSSLPTPGGLVPWITGGTWNFQMWYRDANPTVTSNFTDAVSVTLN